MLMPGMGAARMALRVGTFGASLHLLLLVRPGVRRHPASWLAIGVVGTGQFRINPVGLAAAMAAAYLYW